MSGVVLTDLMAPPAAIAMASTAAVTSSGSSQMTSTSWSPKVNQPWRMLPPMRSTTGRMTSRRCWGFFNRADDPKGV